MKTNKRLICEVERKWNGTTFSQEIEWDGVEDPQKACDRYERQMLGKDYRVISYRII